MESMTMNASAADRLPKLLLVDDEPTNLHVLRQILQADYRLVFARDGEKALQLALSEAPDLILLDVMMPGLSGLDVCRRLKATPSCSAIPVIFVTALADASNEAEGLGVGAVDYVTKPVNAAVVRARIQTHLSLVAMDELRKSRLELVEVLGRAAEYKDNETGLHVARMARYSVLIAEAAGWSKAACDDLLHAASMHDVGKIAVPDSILKKPGPLNDAEWQIMRSHALVGADIIGDHSSELLSMARRIARSHHERWDGTGYPDRLAGTDIPVEARIVAVADVFDALTSNRPYKVAWSVADAVAQIRSDAGRHFDPEIVEHFLAALPRILEVRASGNGKVVAAA
jgi:putative two-component system response regulator